MVKINSKKEKMHVSPKKSLVGFTPKRGITSTGRTSTHKRGITSTLCWELSWFLSSQHKHKTHFSRYLWETKSRYGILHVGICGEDFESKK
jgi:hypothetical protein